MPAEVGTKTNRERFGPQLGDKFTVRRGLNGGYKFIAKTRKPKLKPNRTPHSNVVLTDYMNNMETFIKRGWLDWWGYGGKRGVYFNADLTGPEYDKIFLKAKMSHATYKYEPALMKTKLFDYRFMHFVEATYLFTRYYSDAYGRMMEVVDDVSLGSFQRGFKGGDILLEGSKKNRTSIWRARMHADLHGIPYGFYCQEAIRWAMEDKIWQRPPKPNHLLNPEMMAAVLERWHEHCENILVVPKDERYLLEYGVGEPYQEEFQIWFCNQIRKRWNPDISLKKFMFDKPMITMENAIKYVGQRHVDKVLQLTSKSK